MACRLLNLHPTQALRIDLRGGFVLTVEAGARSAALREEWLYDNHHIADWERAGWLQRVPARLADVGTEWAPPEAAEAAVAKPARAQAATAPITKKRAARARK